jgi:endonuclease YncB( thermonuclease family)
MRRWLFAPAVVAALLVAPLSGARSTLTGATVDHVYDGDTLTLTSGYRVRLLQIDTLSSGPASATPARRERRS